MTAAASTSWTEPVLDISDFSVAYRTAAGDVRAVDHVNLTLHAGEVVGLAGESGSGKSTLAYGATRLLRPPALITSGNVLYSGRRAQQPVEILQLQAGDLQRLRWREVAIVFQSAMNALNPVLKVADQLVDGMRAHLRLSRDEAMEKAAELLDLVSIPRARLRSYPHELSGGMRQRVMIAMALAADPELVIMDEPTTALDVVVQRDILAQIMELKQRLGLSILFITHDISLLLELADRIAVMYAGRLVEVASAQQIQREAGPPVHQGAAEFVPVAARRPARAGRDTGLAAGPAQPAGWLLVLAAVRFRHPGVRGDRHGARTGEFRLGPDARDRVPVRAARHAGSRPACSQHREGRGRAHHQPERRLAGAGRADRARRDQGSRRRAWRRGAWDVSEQVGTAVEIESAAAERGELALQAHGLSKDFRLGRGQVLHAVRDVSFGLYRGAVVALVGESGSGKSTVARLLAGQERLTAGTISLDGEPVSLPTRSAFRRYKSSVQMVFQDPFSSLNPVHTVRYHLERPIRLHQGKTSAAEMRPEIAQPAHPGPAHPAGQLHRQVPARAIRRAAAARRVRPRAGGQAGRAARGRAGVDARRVDPAGDARPARRPAQAAAARAALHHP